MGEKFKGIKERHIYVKETTFATGGDLEADGSLIGKDTKINQSWRKGWQEILNNGSGDRSVSSREKGPLDLPYTLNFIPFNWEFLKYVFDFTNTGSSPTVHTLTVPNTLLSYKMEWAFQNASPLYIQTVGNFIKDITISFAKSTGGNKDSFINVACNCHAKDYSKETSIVAGDFSVSKAAYQFRNVNLVLNNVQTCAVNNGEVRITQGVNPNDSRYACVDNDGLIDEPIPTLFRVNARFNVTPEDSTYFDDWDDGVVINNCALNFIQTALEDELDLNFVRVYYFNAVPNTNLEGIDTFDIVIEADSIGGTCYDDLTW